MASKLWIDGKKIYLGNKQLMNNQKIILSNSTEEKMQKLEEEGKTTMILAVDGTIEGLIAVADTLKKIHRRRFPPCKKWDLRYL